MSITFPTSEDDLDEMPRGLPRPKFDMSRINAYRKEFAKDCGERGDELYPLYKDSLPMPYSAKTSYIARLSDSRSLECVKDCVCEVCGDVVEFNEAGYITALFKDGKMNFESAPYHPKCAVMTMKLCPHIAASDEWSVAMISRETWLNHRSLWVVKVEEQRAKESAPVKF